MATLTGQNIANTYKQLLQIGSDNAGLTTLVQTVQDGSGTNSALQLSQSAVNINGTFQLNGTTLTATASALNAVPNITAYTGFIAVSGTNINGRTLTGGTGVSISNADGTEGNPVIALNTTGVTSGTYGPATNFEVNAVGQVVSAGVAASVSVSAVTANTFVGGTFEGTTGNFSSNVSVGGNLIITGDFTPAAVSTSAVNATAYVSTSAVNAATGTFSSTVSAAFFYGDGSNLTNVPSAEGGTVKRVEAGQGIRITVDGAVSASIPVSGTVAVSANQNFGTVSVSTALAVTGSAKFGIVSATNVDADELLIAGVSAATVTEVAAVSALTQVNLDSITSINTVVGNVSAVTSVNSAAITSINTVVANVSAVTSVNAAAITSINAIIGDGGNFATSAELATVSAYATSIVQALSATMATSINNSNTNITTNANAITSINTVVAGVSALTSVNAAAITSINTVVANVSALTSVNAAAITSINAVIEGNVSADSGTFNTLTVITSASIGGTLNVGGITGIGTASPDASVQLDVNGQLLVRSTGVAVSTTPGSQYGFYIQPDSSGTVNLMSYSSGGSTDIQFFTNSGGAAAVNAMTITSDGETLIGTTSTGSKLRVSKGSSSNAVLFEGSGYQTYFGFGANDDNYISSGASGSTILRTASTERMRINSSGNVGIGTSSPSYLTHLYSTSAEPKLVIEDASSGAGRGGTLTGSWGGNGLRLDSLGAAGWVYVGGSNTSYIPFTIGTEKARFHNNGNFGLGTTAPAKQLEITKSARATITSLTDATSITSDFDAAQNFAVTLGGNRTLANPSNIDPGQTGSIFVVQDGTGGRTLSFGSYWKFAGGTAPTMSTGASAVDRIDYVVYTSIAIHAVATLNLS